MKVKTKEEIMEELRRQSNTLFDNEKNKQLSEHFGSESQAKISSEVSIITAAKMTALRWVLGLSDEI